MSNPAPNSSGEGGNNDAFDCEFNAPQFFDFSEMNKAEAEDDFGFEDKGEAEKYFEVDHESEREKAKAEAATAKTSSSSSSLASTAASSPSVRELLKAREETPSRKLLREKVQKTVESVANSPKIEVPKPQIRRSGVSSTSSTPSTTGAPSPLKQKVGLGGVSGGRVTKQSQPQASPAVQKWRAIAKRVMVTPEIMKKVAKRIGNAAAAGSDADKNSEQAKRTFKAQLARTHRSATQSTAASRAKRGVSPAKSTAVSATGPAVPMRPTMPQPFSFVDRDLAKVKEKVAHSNEDRKADFYKDLRSYTDHPEAKPDPLGTTKVQPFHFHGRHRRSRSVDRATDADIGGPMRARRGVSPTPSMASSTGSTASVPARPTEPQPFSFVDRDLAKVREKVARRSMEEKSKDFYKDLRSYNEQDTKVHDLEPTRFQPFSFHQSTRRRRSRSLDRHDHQPESKAPRLIKAKPAPHFGVPVHLPNVSQRPINTVAAPFSFHSHDQARLVRKQEKIDKILEEEKKAREFKANPMPNLDKASGLPAKEVLEATRAQPFNLEIEKRVEPRLNKWQEQVEEELRQQRKNAEFHARPAEVLEKAPFVPKQSEKPLSEMTNVELHSDRRAADREAYERHKKLREADMEAMKRQLEDRRQAELEEEIRRQRAEAVHKAQPVRHYKPVEVQKSERPLTAPVSPKMSVLNATKKRLHEAGGADSQN